MSRQRLFGTDGVRGVANEVLTAVLALQLGMAAGHWVCGANVCDRRGRRFTVVIGRDTRLSGDMLEAAIAAGLAAAGVDVLNVGIVPTPAVAQIVLALGASAGIVISASHNPFEDNGIKLFGPNGRKLPDSVEDNIETIVGRLAELVLPTGGAIGRINESRDPVQLYLDRVEQTVGGRMAAPLQGLTLTMDCANGAAYELAPILFRELGAQITVMHAEPDGVNINVQCGSTKPQSMAARVIETGSHAGLAFDGDADRVLLADEHGNIVDGDRMMAILAIDMHERGNLPGDVVVSTIMSNVGLEQALRKRQIRLHRTDVGDRYVGEAMETLGAAVGGEQSGHILLPHLTPTGDGLVTALHVLRIMRESGKPLSELASIVQSCPQLLKSVRVRSKQGWREDAEIRNAIARGQERLGSAEWLSVRPSGTEPLIRVMAQGTDTELVESVVHDICAVIESRYGSMSS